MRTLVVFVLFGLNAWIACKEKPSFPSELTQYSDPVPGILPYFQGSRMDPFWPHSKDRPADLRRMNNAIFRTEQDKAASALDHAKGKYSLVTFFYSSCVGLCPLIAENMKSLSSRIENQSDIQFISITIDPEIDDVKALQKFRAKHNITQKNWILLTGDKKTTESLAREQFAGEIKIKEGKAGLVDFVHTENVFLLDKEGYLRGIYRARGVGDFPRLLIDLKRLRDNDT